MVEHRYPIREASNQSSEYYTDAEDNLGVGLGEEGSVKPHTMVGWWSG
jgi:hypothetical protein